MRAPWRKSPRIDVVEVAQDMSCTADILSSTATLLASVKG